MNKVVSELIQYGGDDKAIRSSQRLTSGSAKPSLRRSSRLLTKEATGRLLILLLLLLIVLLAKAAEAARAKHDGRRQTGDVGAG